MSYDASTRQLVDDVAVFMDERWLFSDGEMLEHTFDAHNGTYRDGYYEIIGACVVGCLDLMTHRPVWQIGHPKSVDTDRTGLNKVLPGLESPILEAYEFAFESEVNGQQSMWPVYHGGAKRSVIDALAQSARYHESPQQTARLALGGLVFYELLDSDTSYAQATLLLDKELADSALEIMKQWLQIGDQFKPGGSCEGSTSTRLLDADNLLFALSVTDNEDQQAVEQAVMRGVFDIIPYLPEYLGVQDDIEDDLIF